MVVGMAVHLVASTAETMVASRDEIMAVVSVADLAETMDAS